MLWSEDLSPGVGVGTESTGDLADPHLLLFVLNLSIWKACPWQGISPKKLEILATSLLIPFQFKYTFTYTVTHWNIMALSMYSEIVVQWMNKTAFFFFFFY